MGLYSKKYLLLKNSAAVCMNAPRNEEKMTDGEPVEVRNGKGYRVVWDDGVPLPPMLQVPRVKQLRKYFQLRGDSLGDIVIATFPKCGTTWMQQIILLLLAEGNRSNVKDPMCVNFISFSWSAC